MKNVLEKVVSMICVGVMCVWFISSAYAQSSDVGSIDEFYSKFDIPYPAQPVNAIAAPEGTLNDSTDEVPYLHSDNQQFWNSSSYPASSTSTATSATSTVYEKAWNWSEESPVYALGIDRGTGAWSGAVGLTTRLLGTFVNTNGNSDDSIKTDYHHIRGKIGWSLDVKFRMAEGDIPSNGSSRDFISVGNIASTYNGVGGYALNWRSADASSGTVTVRSPYAPSGDTDFTFSKDTWYRIRFIFTSSNMRNSEYGLVETTIYKISPDTSTFDEVKSWSKEIDEATDTVFGLGSSNKLSEALRIRIHHNEIQRMTIANAYSVHEAYAVQKPVMENDASNVTASTMIALQYVPESDADIVPAVLVLGAYDSGDKLINAKAAGLTPTSAWTEGSVVLPRTEMAQKYRFFVQRAINDLRLYTAPAELNNN